MYYARLSGIAHCIVPQLLPISNDPSSLIQTPSMELLASIMKPNQQLPLGGSQMPSIVQIIVPAHTLQQIPLVEKLNQTFDVVTSTTTMAPELMLNETANESFSSPSPIEVVSTVEPLRSAVQSTQPQSTTQQTEADKEDDIDDIQLNEDLDSGDDYQENEEKFKKQRDRSDFRYVESFEPEKSLVQKFEPDLSDNDTELKNVINENFQQMPSVLPVPNALSSAKETESEDHEPPEIRQEQDRGATDM